MTDTPDLGPNLPGAWTVPLFPLPGVVLFPRVKLPFYIFEPRYRAMLARALDAEGLIGVPMLKGGGHRSPEAAPQFEEVFGVGRVTDYETHDDGTSHIELLGVARVRLDRELSSTPFRTALALPAPEIEPSPEDSRSLLSDLKLAVARLEPLGMTPEAKESLSALFAQAGDDANFLVNVLSTVVVASAAVRQNLLEEDRVYDRGRHLTVLLETLRQELDGGGRQRPVDPTGDAHA